MKFILSVLIFFNCAVVMANDAQDLLKASDQFRGGTQSGIEWQVRLRTVENGKSSDRTFSVKVKGVDALVEALSPAKFKGEIYLFNDHTMWFFKPSLKKPIAISARQKLSGQAANGDIAATNYARDYTAKLEKSEKVKGVMAQVLLLKAKSDQVTYDQIRYWVSEKSKQALKAEFMTLQGKPFKVATFEYKNTLSSGGKRNPFLSRVTIIDAKFNKNRSVMDYSHVSPASFPSALFNVNNLSR